MKKVRQILSDNPRYNRYKKPLEAANICDVARAEGKGRFGVISYSRGTICLSVNSPAEAANLQAESQKIIDELNQKLGQEIVKRVRFKIQ